jgi:hypothetical protein
MTGKEAVALVLTLGLLVGIAVEKVVIAQPVEGAAEYHERVHAAVSAAPFSVGDWVGTDIPVPTGQVAMLHANIVLSRRYKHVSSGLTAEVLVVHCQDARDLVGHYPKHCYPGAGYQLEAAVPTDWDVDGLKIHGMEYTFSFETATDSRRIAIANFMVLPDGTTAREMEEMNETAQDRRRKHFGAAQFQILVDHDLEAEVRDQVFEQFLGAYRSIIETMLNGVDR